MASGQAFINQVETLLKLNISQLTSSFAGGSGDVCGHRFVLGVEEAQRHCKTCLGWAYLQIDKDRPHRFGELIGNS